MGALWSKINRMKKKNKIRRNAVTAAGQEQGGVEDRGRGRAGSAGSGGRGGRGTKSAVGNNLTLDVQTRYSVSLD